MKQDVEVKFEMNTFFQATVKIWDGSRASATDQPLLLEQENLVFLLSQSGRL